MADINDLPIVQEGDPISAAHHRDMRELLGRGASGPGTLIDSSGVHRRPLEEPADDTRILCDIHGSAACEVPMYGVFPVTAQSTSVGRTPPYTIQDGDNAAAYNAVPGQFVDFAVNTDKVLYGPQHGSYDGSERIRAVPSWTGEGVWALWDQDVMAWGDVLPGLTCGLMHDKNDTYHKFALGPGLPGYVTQMAQAIYWEGSYYVYVRPLAALGAWWCEVTAVDTGTTDLVQLTANPYCRQKSHAYDGADNWPEIEVTVYCPYEYIENKMPHFQVGDIIPYRINLDKLSQKLVGADFYTEVDSGFYSIHLGATPNGWTDTGNNLDGYDVVKKD
jgi:hypothetical protein